MPTPKKPRPTHVQPVEATEDPPAPAPDPPEAVQEVAPPPKPEDIAPLWDTRDEDGPASWIHVGDIDGTRVYRLVPAPGEKPPFKKVLTLTLDPRASVEDISRVRGGGKYLLQAVRKGVAIAGTVVEIEGEPIHNNIAPTGPTPPATPPPAPLAPIMETPSGLAAVQGLDPMVQVLFAMQQQHNAQIREDSWRYNDRMASMFQAAMGRPPGAFAQDAVQLFQTQAERDREEAARLRTQMERMQQAMSQIQMRGAVEQASSRQPVERQVLELALQHGPELTELIKKFLGLEGAPQITPGNGGK
jgi:hypothetical protein